jgi:oligopeptidase A
MNDVEWDAVESPSQVMENWAWEREMLHALSSHEETGESLPDPLIDKLLSSRHYLSALALLRQLEFASVDMKLHIHPTEDPLATLDEVRRRVRVTPTIPEDRFLASFTHIFAGGYAAGYYSYLWAELIAADAFEAFQETGDAFDRSTGDLFLQSVLEMGSSRPFMRSYVEFRGREPEPDALLRSRGLLPSLFA